MPKKTSYIDAWSSDADASGESGKKLSLHTGFRNSRVAELISEGWSPEQISVILDIPLNAILNDPLMGLADSARPEVDVEALVAAAKPIKGLPNEKRCEILTMYLAGHSLEEISEETGCLANHIFRTLRLLPPSLKTTRLQKTHSY